jgi:Transcriptional regulators
MTREEAVRAFRAFNRYYTRLLGLLDEDFLDSPFSLSEARILYEISLAGSCSAKDIRESLGLDAGYLSRTLDSLERRGVLSKTRAEDDRRFVRLGLSEKGAAAFALLDDRSSRSAAETLARLDKAQLGALAQHMKGIQELLGEPWRDAEGGWANERK